jgi:hypothetical protein
MVYVDAGKPYLVEGFTKKTFTAMIKPVRVENIVLLPYFGPRIFSSLK